MAGCSKKVARNTPSVSTARRLSRVEAAGGTGSSSGMLDCSKTGSPFLLTTASSTSGPLPQVCRHGQSNSKMVSSSKFHHRFQQNLSLVPAKFDKCRSKNHHLRRVSGKFRNRFQQISSPVPTKIVASSSKYVTTKYQHLCEIPSKIRHRFQQKSLPVPAKIWPVEAAVWHGRKKRARPVFLAATHSHRCPLLAATPCGGHSGKAESLPAPCIDRRAMGECVTSSVDATARENFKAGKGERCSHQWGREVSWL